MRLVSFLGYATATLAVMALLFFAPVLGVLCGAFSGWVVGYFFPATFAPVVVFFHVPTMWQLGAILGFIGGFFKSTQTNNEKG